MSTRFHKIEIIKPSRIVTTIGGTTNSLGLSANVLQGCAITPKWSGVLKSIGFDLLSIGTGANLRLGMYSTLSASKFSGMLSQSASAAAVAGWNDPIVPDTIINAATTYYVVFIADTSQLTFYYLGNFPRYVAAQAFGVFPDPSPTLTTLNNNQINMRITYRPKQTMNLITQNIIS